MSKNPFFARGVALERGWFDVYAKETEEGRARSCARELDDRRRGARGGVPSSEREVGGEGSSQTARH